MDDDQLYEVGQLYKAVSERELVEVEPALLAPGLKVHIDPEQVAILNAVKKELRSTLGYKPDLAVLINAMIATVDWDDDRLALIAGWISDRREIPREVNKAKNTKKGKSRPVDDDDQFDDDDDQ